MGHGIMFHHFHSADHGRRPGSLSAEELDALIDFIEERHVILSPVEFAERAAIGCLSDRDVVLTFDDALRSQVDVAIPVVEARGLIGLFNVYSAPLVGQPEPLEIFAAFRHEAFATFEEFWGSFRELLFACAPETLRDLESQYKEDYLASFPFYTHEEKQFRFLRDMVLGPSRYQDLMWRQIREHSSFDVETVSANLWMDKEALAGLVSGGHSVGLHSHTHPTRMDLLPPAKQRQEYEQNYSWIESNLALTPFAVAHPCGAYSEETIAILLSLRISIGFRSSLTPGVFGSPLEVPREDHANLFKKMVAA